VRSNNRAISNALVMLAAVALIGSTLFGSGGMCGRTTSADPDRGAQEEKVREERDPALDTLRRRDAAGEVSQEEYENMRKNLRAIPASR
jgi:hypothetical protein